MVATASVTERWTSSGVASGVASGMAVILPHAAG
jgi:hypothetical protein